MCNLIGVFVVLVGCSGFKNRSIILQVAQRVNTLLNIIQCGPFGSDGLGRRILGGSHRPSCASQRYPDYSDQEKLLFLLVQVINKSPMARTCK